jgi:hypothetical protein
MVSMVHKMCRPPFFVELASDDGRLESLEARRTRGLLRFLEEDIDSLRSLNANPRAASDSAIRAGPIRKRKSIFLTARIKLRYAAPSLYEREL